MFPELESSALGRKILAAIWAVEEESGHVRPAAVVYRTIPEVLDWVARASEKDLREELRVFLPAVVLRIAQLYKAAEHR